MSYEFVAVFEKKENAFIAYVEDIPGINLQGRTLEETRQDLKEAIELVSGAAKTLAERKGIKIRPHGIVGGPRGGRAIDADFTRHLVRQGCIFHRKGKKYSVFIHPSSGKISTVPHLRKIENALAQKICNDLGIPKSQFFLDTGSENQIKTVVK